tara:strand:+ start:4350 stop:5405 length:1056 start_codon:yes stop_codon:yes gene_type:complete
MTIAPTIFIVPTGIGCEIGGFAGDALPVAKLLASASGCLVTHPNVMNGGSLSESDERIFYLEGYSLDRFAKGELGLKKVKQQKIGIIFDAEIEKNILIRHLQATDACIATLGINIESYVITNNPVGVVLSNQTSGGSTGYIKNPEELIKAGEKLVKSGVTAIAIVTKFPDNLDNDEINSYRKGEGVDSIAGAEAVISHLISKYLKVPCAHAPAFAQIDIEERLDPRAASEEIGFTFLPSVLIGLNKAPNLIELPSLDKSIDLYPNQVEAIIVPQGALGGEAVMASMERGVSIISVKNSSALNVCNNYLNYPNYTEVNNYFEAAGLLLSIREGINSNSIQRPIIPFSKYRIN